MASVYDQFRVHPRHAFVKSTGIAVATGAGDTELVTLDVRGMKRMALEVINQGANAFDEFIIQGRFHRDGNFVSLYTTGYTTPTGILMGASGDLTVLAAAATGWFIMDVSGLESVKVLASGNGATTADVYAGASAR